ncbi:flagellar hook-length control protein [Mycolicibacter kumamotonensis]|uniref:Flagellar hook-length control protein n=1 Tax=Mycolicibacter kumamotonensis TaxID=354243 RepID=A0A7K3LGG5_9MYCO|nr:flagellar hook-length control protein [Mycolicibacter kumamotonensis]NDJ91464.1 flagellar hook-length control protein [Mycolicibacter kumamotonensis]
MTTMTKRDAADAALSVAEDIAAGRLDPAALEAELVAAMSALIDADHEPGSPLGALQVAVARRVLARGDLPVDEVAEWVSVARSRVGPTETPTPA